MWEGTVVRGTFPSSPFCARVPFLFTAIWFLVVSQSSGSTENPSLAQVIDEVAVGVLNTFHHVPPPEAFLTTPELIQLNNYPVETHFVITEDGYNLTMFRIPRGKRGKPPGGEPIIVQHALLSDSSHWLVLMPHSEDNLPFVLADAGYDVWLTNNRGTNYSLRHLTKSPDTLEFWDFSFHEMGIYDTPSFIEYILAKTGKRQLSYLGHSMGCSEFFIGMIRLPHLQRKVRKMIALAPAAIVEGTKSPIAILVSLVPTPLLQIFFDALKDGRILTAGVNQWLLDNGPSICSGTIPRVMCMNLVFLIAGYDYQQTNNYTAAMIMGHAPTQAPAKSLVHFFQLLRRGKFEEYDFGFLGNLEKYGNPNPPTYNLMENTVDTFVLWGRNDWLVVPQSSAATIRALGNVTRSQPVENRKYNHLDFAYAKDAKAMVYDHCLDYLAY